MSTFDKKIKLCSVQGLDGQNRDQIVIPGVFLSDLRPDIVRFVYSSLSSNLRLPYSVKSYSGHEYSAKSQGNNKAMARIPRLGGIFSRRGRNFSAECCMCRGGHFYSTTQIWRRWHIRASDNLKNLAIYSALAAASVSSLVYSRGHRVELIDQLPFVVCDELEMVRSSISLNIVLGYLKVFPEFTRLMHHSIRNRNYRNRFISRTLLMVYLRDKGLKRAVRNFYGLEAVFIYSLNLTSLAVGGNQGRFIIWTKSSLLSLCKFASYAKYHVHVGGIPE